MLTVSSIPLGFASRIVGAEAHFAWQAAASFVRDQVVACPLAIEQNSFVESIRSKENSQIRSKGDRKSEPIR